MHVLVRYTMVLIMIDYIDLFRQYDDPVHWLAPPTFDDQAAEARVLGFAAELAAALGGVGLKTETGNLLQDANYHGEIFLPTGGPSTRRYGSATLATSPA